jgi:hypothetical protein
MLGQVCYHTDVQTLVGPQAVVLTHDSVMGVTHVHGVRMGDIGYVPCTSAACADRSRAEQVQSTWNSPLQCFAAAAAKEQTDAGPRGGQSIS